MSYQVKVTCGFITKTQEQAEHIQKLFQDLHAVLECESSDFSSEEIYGDFDG